MADRPRSTRSSGAGRPARAAGRVRTAGKIRTPTASVAPSGTPAAAPRRRLRPRLTGRAAILVLLVAVLAVSYASSARAYLDQRSRIVELKAEIAERSASIAELEREKRRWGDDAFLAQQARDRLGYVFPGETSYRVLDGDGEPLDSAHALDETVPALRATPTAWWETAWRSVELAGHPPRAR